MIVEALTFDHDTTIQLRISYKGERDKFNDATQLLREV